MALRKGKARSASQCSGASGFSIHRGSEDGREEDATAVLLAQHQQAVTTMSAEGPPFLYVAWPTVL
jgi:hypothetical protein